MKNMKIKYEKPEYELKTKQSASCFTYKNEISKKRPDLNH